MENTSILFLDIDGVLNNERHAINHKKATGLPTRLYTVDPLCIRHLNTIIEKTDCKIVVSSTWRKMKDLIGIEAVLKEAGFEYKLHGRTGVLNKERGYEIEEFINEHGVKDYAIIDDDSDMLESQMDSFFQTEPEVGLTRGIAYKIINHLTPSWAK